MKVRIAAAAVTMSCRWTRTSRGLKDHHACALDLVAKIGIGDGLFFDEVHRQATRAFELAAQLEEAGSAALQRAAKPDEYVQVARRRACAALRRGAEEHRAFDARAAERGEHARQAPPQTGVDARGHGRRRRAGERGGISVDEPLPLEPLDLALYAGRPAAGEADQLTQVVRPSRLREKQGEHSRTGLGAEERRKHCELLLGTFVPVIGTSSLARLRARRKERPQAAFACGR